MSRVETDLQAMIDFRSHLLRFNRLLADEYRSIRGNWNSLGGVWRDQKYRELGDALDEVGKGIDRYLAATDDHERHLLRLIDTTKQYFDIH